MQLRGDELIVRRFPCFKCTIGVLCDECRNAPGIRDRVVTSVTEVEEEEVEEEEEDNEEEIDDVGNSDEELSSEDDESDEEETGDEGDAIIWAAFGYRKKVFKNRILVRNL